MSKDESSDYFNEEMKHNLVSDFVVSYYNSPTMLDLAKKVKGGLGNQVFYMSSDTLDKYTDEQVISFKRDTAYAVYSNYGYEVIVRDERFAELSPLLDKFSRSIEIPDSELPAVEKKLYSFIMLLKKENRIRIDFKLKPFHDAQMDALSSNVRKTVELLTALEKRVKGIENNPFLKTGITK